MSASTAARDIYPLTPLQHGMLFHELYEPEERLYLEQITVPFSGQVHWPAFTAAWQDLAEHHDALRTSFHWQGISTPVQVVHDHVELPVAAVDLHGDRRWTAEQYLTADRRAGFALDAAPLLRVALLRVDTDDIRLVLSFHHIILDGWSLQVLMRDFGLAYDARVAGRRPDLPPTGRYRDYLVWLARQDLAAAESFWREHLRGYAGPVPLWSEPEPDAAREPYGDHELALSEERTAAARRAAARCRVTLGTLAHAAWVRAIGAATGTDDVVTGVTVAGRPAELAGADQMVGLFINTIPVRTRIDPGAELGTWLREVQRDLVLAREHDHTPLVLAQRCSGLPAGVPLFDQLVAFENYPVHGRRADGSTVAATFAGADELPLSAAIVPGPRLRLRVLNDRRRVADGTARRVALRFEQLVDAIGTGDTAAVGDLPVLIAGDRHHLTVLDDTTRPYADGQTVHGAFDRQVRLRPDAPALELGDDLLTYAELARHAADVARRLRAAGVGRGDRVALLADRSAELVIAMLAVLQVGAAYVPLDTASPARRLAGIVADIGATVVAATPASAGDARDLAARVVVVDRRTGRRPGEGCDGGRRGRAPSRRRLRDAHLGLDRDSRRGSSSATGPSSVWSPAPTTCSSARPTASATCRTCAFDAATFEIWGPLLNGGTVVGIDQRTATTPDRLASQLRELGVTTLFVTTALFNRIAADRPDALRHAAVRAVRRRGGRRRLRCDASSPPAGPTACSTSTARPRARRSRTWHEIDAVAGRRHDDPDRTAAGEHQGLRARPRHATGADRRGRRAPHRRRRARPRLQRPAGHDRRARSGPTRSARRPGDGCTAPATSSGWCPTASSSSAGGTTRSSCGASASSWARSSTSCAPTPRSVGSASWTTSSTAGATVVLVAYVAAPPGVDHGRLRTELGQLLADRLPRYMHPSPVLLLPELPLNANGKVDRAALRGLVARVRP